MGFKKLMLLLFLSNRSKHKKMLCLPAESPVYILVLGLP